MQLVWYWSIQHDSDCKAHMPPMSCISLRNTCIYTGDKQAGKESLFWQKFWQSCGWTTNTVLRPSSATQHHRIRRSGTPQPIIILVCCIYIPWIFSSLPLLCKLFSSGKFIVFLPQQEALSSVIISCCSRMIANWIICHTCCTMPFLYYSNCISNFGNCLPVYIRMYVIPGNSCSLVECI